MSRSDKQKEKPVYTQCTDLYFQFFKEKVGVSPKFEAKHGVAMKAIIKHLGKIVKEKQPDIVEPELDKEVVNSFDYILTNWHKLSEFTQQHMDICSMNSNFNKIIIELKNGHSKGANRPASKVTGTDLHEAVAKFRNQGKHAGNSH